jgi:hypothetical protein
MGEKEMIQKKPVFVEYKTPHVEDTFVEKSVGVRGWSGGAYKLITAN